MEVTPFRGIRYNRGIVGDLWQVICPPYDVISPEQQRLYYEKSHYNAIRLEFPAPTGDRYQTAATTFQQWLRQDILQRDSSPTLYLHEHQFTYLGRNMTRRGVIARVRLEPWGSGVFPHEETSSKDKSDRLQLMRACRANFSPLFSLYRDSRRKIAPILSRVAQGKPLVSSRAGGCNSSDLGEAHHLWTVTEPKAGRDLGDLLSREPIYIADGHHRYETALTYRQERAQEQSDSCKRSADGFQYVMMELVEFSDPGLIVLPLHRLVRGIPPSSLANLVERLRDFFTLESMTLTTNSWHLPADSYLGILGLQPDSLMVLKKRQGVALEAMMPENRSEAYREFDVSILNHIVLDIILSETKDEDIAYSVDLGEARRQITEGKYQLGFVLHPPRPEMVGAVTDAQDRLPRKSTYFYPKLPAGLVINPLD